MIQPIFILGRPGSGKSTVSAYLTHWAHEQGWHSKTLAGFPFLQQLSRHPAYTSWFTPHDHYGGFLVTNDQAYSHVDEQMAYQASLLLRAHEQREKPLLLTIELSQGTYEDSLLLYEPAFRQQAQVLHLALPYETCVARIEERVVGKGNTEDTHRPPEQFLIKHCLNEQLPGPRVIAPERFITLDNTGSQEGLYRQLDQVAQRLFVTREEVEVHP